MNPAVVDICCGIGGFSLGFRKAGFKVIAGIDIDEKALAVFARNFPESKTILADLRELRPDDVPDADVYIGGVPCQPFSAVNPQASSWNAELVAKFLEIAITKRKMFVLENVPPLAYALGHGVILDSYDFGVPQRRKRLFFANFPILPYRRVNRPLGYFFPDVEAITFRNTNSSFRLLHRIKRYYESAFTIGERDIMNKLVFKLIGGGERDVTVEDLKVLFGFPKDFRIEEDEKHFIGESVCPPVAYHVAKSCLHYMPTFYSIVGGKRWVSLNLRPEERLCAQFGLSP